MFMTLAAAHYNLLIVLIGAASLGVSAGLVGCFLYLRKESLIADTVTHATLPGIAIGFLINLTLGLDEGRYLPVLLTCAGLSASLGALSVRFIITHTRLKQDAAIAAMMSFFYAIGLGLLSYIQFIPHGHKAGLGHFLLGHVSGLVMSDLIFLSLICTLVIIVLTLLFKPLCMIAFDKTYAHLNIKCHTKYDLALSAMMICVVCAGIKTVGVILILALLIIPAASARQITHSCKSMFIAAGGIGATACLMGTLISIVFNNIPTGASIILCAFILLCLCLLARVLIRKDQGTKHA